MRHLTIRQVPPELSRALEEEKRRRGQSLNRTVLDLLARALGITPGGRRSNGLRRFSGTWTQEELEEFEKAIEITEQIDPELWR
jgi:protein involved in polysaccharide export with SLBB domain